MIGAYIVPITPRHVAVVSPEDFPRVSGIRWHRQGRGYVCGNGGQPLLHRLILGAQPGEIVDHINRDPLDNRRENLRIVTTAQNGANGGRRASNTSGYRGVSWDKARGRWQAKLQVNRRHFHLGRFDSAEEAARAYDAAARELLGEFAGLNFPSEYTR